MDYENKYKIYKQKYIGLKQDMYEYKRGHLGLKPYFTISDDYLLNIDESRTSKKIITLAEQHNINPTSATIIDMGCGHGNNSLSLSFYFAKVYGFDINQEMIETCKYYKSRLKQLRDNFNPEKVVFKVANFEHKLPIKTQVNIILLANAIHFAESEKIATIIDNLLNHVNKNGLIIILEPSVNANFADPELNKPGVKRENKMKKINRVANQLQKYFEILESTNKIEVEFQNLQKQYIAVLKKL